MERFKQGWRTGISSWIQSRSSTSTKKGSFSGNILWWKQVLCSTVRRNQWRHSAFTLLQLVYAFSSQHANFDLARLCPKEDGGGQRPGQLRVDQEQAATGTRHLHKRPCFTNLFKGLFHGTIYKKCIERGSPDKDFSVPRVVSCYALGLQRNLKGQ